MKRTIVLIGALVAGLAVGASAQVKVGPGSTPGKHGPGPGSGGVITTKLSGSAPKTGRKTNGTKPGKPAQAKPDAQGSGTGADGTAKAPASSGQ
jgi:hypothetical protein